MQQTYLTMFSVNWITETNLLQQHSNKANYKVSESINTIQKQMLHILALEDH